MKKIFTLLTAVMLYVSTMSAASVLIGDLYYELNDSYWTGSEYVKGARVMSSPAKYTGKVVIPESVVYNDKNYPVVAIGNSAFGSCSGLTEVVIPNSVIEIEGQAFSGCTSMTTIEIPNSIKNIRSYAFRNCDGLTEVVLPNSVTNIEHDVFYDCDNLVSVTLPNSITEIPSSLFSSCDKLSYIEIPSTVKTIGGSAFYYCPQLSVIQIPNSVVTIGSSAFGYCSALTSITLPSSVETVGSGAFQSCTSLNTVALSSNINSLASDAFQNCNVQAIHFDGTLAEWCSKRWLPSYVSNAYTLYINGEKMNSSNIVLPNGLESIGYQAFNGCAGIFAVTVPSSVTSIGTGHTIPIWYFSGNTPAELAEGAFTDEVCLIVDNVAAYKAAWPQYESRIFPRTGTTQNVNVTAKSNMSALHQTIGEENLINVIDLTISGTINSYDLMLIRNKMINLRYLDLTNASIEASLYEYYTGFCSHADTLLAHSFRNLLSIKLPKTLKYAEQALIDCPDLKYAEFNGGVIGTQVAPYTGNGDLDVVLNEGVTGIEAYAFAKTGISHKYYRSSDYNSYNNTKLHSISLPNSLNKVEAKRFWYCRNLQEVTLGDAITEIDDYAFCECPALTAIILPSALQQIGDFAFQGANVGEVTIPSEVRKIGNGAFLSGIGGSDWHNGSMERIADELYIYSNSTSIYRFYNNKLQGGYLHTSDDDYWYTPTTTLRKLTFAPDSKLNEIGVCAFAFSQLSEINIPDSVATIGDYAFVGSHQLKSVKFGEKSALRSIERGVFQNCDALEEVILPAELTNISELAFSSHTTSDALKEIAIPSKLKSIDRAAFYGRKGLEKISFPTSLQTIGDYAFQGCSGLDEIKVPSTLLSVGNYAFDDCSNVTKVYTYTVEPVAIDQNTFSCWHNADLYVPSTSYYTYFYNTQWSQFLSLKQFDEAYEYFYINNDYELGGGNGTIDGKPDADLNENSGLIVTGDTEQQVGVITIAGDENGAASIIACEENLVADSLVIRLITQKGIWSYFCFPFDIVLDQLSFAHQYVIRQYDGATRAQYGAGGWMNMVGNVLQKGLGYIFQGAQTDTLQITIKNPKIGCQDYEQLVKAHSAENAIHANWNFIGNPFPSWYDLDALFAGGFSSPVYIWDTKTQDYKVYKPGDDEYHFHPYEGFFTQNPNGQDMNVKWPSDGRETKTQADNKHHGNHAPARIAARNAYQEKSARKLVNIQLSSSTYTDRARIVFNDAASMEYELGRDAVVMGGQAPLHIWSINGENRLAINERPYGLGRVNLGYEVSEDGFYTLSASRMDTAVIIYDNVLQQEVDLTQGDYVFSTEAGVNTTRFSIARIKAQEENTTGIDEAVVDRNEIVNVYNMLGVKVLDNVRRSDIKLTSGIYIVENQHGAKTELNIQ